MLPQMNSVEFVLPCRSPVEQAVAAWAAKGRCRGLMGRVGGWRSAPQPSLLSQGSLADVRKLPDMKPGGGGQGGAAVHLQKLGKWRFSIAP